MTNIRKRWLPLIVICLAAIVASVGIPLLNAPAAFASEPTGFQNVVLSIYPEYDDPLGIGSPTLLVMLDGQISGVTPPTTIRFLVPTAAFMYSAGSGPRNQYQGGTPDRKPSDTQGWDEISYELKTTTFVVEYYLPIQTTPNKSFSADFIPLYPVVGLNVIVQQPKQSTEFSLTPQTPPATQQRSVDGQGFNVTQYTYPSLKALETLAFSISYVKGGLNIVLLVGIAIAVIVIGGGLWWVLTRPSPGKRGRGRGRAAARPQAGKATGGRFCPKCGARAEKGSRFCPECGTKMRQ